MSPDTGLLLPAALPLLPVLFAEDDVDEDDEEAEPYVPLLAAEERPPPIPPLAKRRAALRTRWRKYATTPITKKATRMKTMNRYFISSANTDIIFVFDYTNDLINTSEYLKSNTMP